MGAVSRRRALALATTGFVALAAGPAAAVDPTVIEARVDAALVELQATVPGADLLLERAVGVLIMPQITKAGFVVGGTYGEGALRIDGVTAAYYSIAGGSFGLQAGVERFSQVLLFMTQPALDNFRTTPGWEAGADAEVTLLEAGFDAGAGTKVTNRPVIGIVFGQSGLLAGASVRGTKYTRIER